MIENQILFETRLEQLAREVIEQETPRFDDVPASDFYGTEIQFSDEYIEVDAETYVHIDNWFRYSEDVLGYHFSVKK